MLTYEIAAIWHWYVSAKINEVPLKNERESANIAHITHILNVKPIQKNTLIVLVSIIVIIVIIIQLSMWVYYDILTRR